MSYSKQREQLEYIQDLLKRKYPSSPESLAKKLGVSEETIKRRINNLGSREKGQMIWCMRPRYLSYMQLGNFPVGLLINFHTKLLKNGIKRYVI